MGWEYPSPIIVKYEFEAGLILDFLLLWFNCRLFFNDPMVLAFYNVGEVLYNWTGVRFVEIKRNN